MGILRWARCSSGAPEATGPYPILTRRDNVGGPVRCDACRMAEAPPACQRERMASDVVTLTRDLVRLDTINPPGAEAACAQQVARLLETAGFELGTYDFAPGRTSLVARIGGR